MKSRILIICSSSGGHIYPGLGLGKYLEENNYSVTYLGIENQLETKLIEKDKLITVKLPKSFKKMLKDIHYLRHLQALKKIDKLISANDIIIGFGGFITAFSSLAPALNKKIFLLHEQNLVLGDSNAFALKKAKVLLTSFKLANEVKIRSVNVGNPSTYLFSECNKDPFKVIFFAGSLGSSSLLGKIKELVSLYQFDFPFDIVTNDKLYDEFSSDLILPKNVHIHRSLDIKSTLNSYSLMIIRGGATSLFEAVNLNINMIVIPSPYVKNDHQRINAKYIIKEHLGEVIQEDEFDPKVIYEMIKRFKEDYSYAYSFSLNQKRVMIKHPEKEILKIIQEYE